MDKFSVQDYLTNIKGYVSNLNNHNTNGGEYHILVGFPGDWEQLAVNSLELEVGERYWYGLKYDMNLRLWVYNDYSEEKKIYPYKPELPENIVIAEDYLKDDYCCFIYV